MSKQSSFSFSSGRETLQKVSNEIFAAWGDRKVKKVFHRPPCTPVPLPFSLPLFKVELKWRLGPALFLTDLCWTNCSAAFESFPAILPKCGFVLHVRPCARSFTQNTVLCVQTLTLAPSQNHLLCSSIAAATSPLLMLHKLQAPRGKKARLRAPTSCWRSTLDGVGEALSSSVWSVRRAEYCQYKSMRRRFRQKYFANFTSSKWHPSHKALNLYPVRNVSFTVH